MWRVDSFLTRFKTTFPQFLNYFLLRNRPIYKAFHTLLSGSDSISKIKAQEVVDITSKINDGLKEFLKSRTAIGKKVKW